MKTRHYKKFRSSNISNTKDFVVKQIMLNFFKIILALLLLSVVSASAQMREVAVTFDDLPATMQRDNFADYE